MTRETNICRRCAEPLVKRPDNGLCVWCVEERAREAVGVFVAASGSDDNAALKARADATDRLRRLGFDRNQVLHLRAQVLDGIPVKEIVKGLVHGVGETEAVAA